MTQTTTTAPPRVGRIARWKLTEPARLYLWPAVALQFVVNVAVDLVALFWLDVALRSVALAVLLLAVACTRASVFSPRAMVQTVLQSRQ